MVCRAGRSTTTGSCGAIEAATGTSMAILKPARRALSRAKLAAGGLEAYFSRGWARSSAGEHCLDMAGATGSIPVAPTIRPDANAWPAPDRWSGPRVAMSVPAGVRGDVMRLARRLVEHAACQRNQTLRGVGVARAVGVLGQRDQAVGQDQLADQARAWLICGVRTWMFPRMHEIFRCPARMSRGDNATYGLGTRLTRAGKIRARQAPAAPRPAAGPSRARRRPPPPARSGSVTLGGDMHKRRPELLLQCDAGAVAGERETALDQATQPPPPGSVAPGTVIAAGTTQRSKSSGRTKPSCSAACFKRDVLRKGAACRSSPPCHSRYAG